MDTKTDERGIEYAEGVTVDALPAGWALCNGCGRAWNDAKPTGWTPAPSGRCPFEYEHEDEDEAPDVERELELELATVPDEDPDVSWLEQTAEQIGAEAAAANAERLAAYRADEWHLVGVRVRARVTLTDPGDHVTRFELASPGLWGIEDDSGRDYFAEVGREELAALRTDLLALGFTAAEIDEATPAELKEQTG